MSPFNIILPTTTRSSKCSLSLRFPHKTRARNSSSNIRVTCATYLILFDLNTRIIFGQKYRSTMFLLRSILHSSIHSSLLGPSVFLRTLFSVNFSLCFSLTVRDRVSLPWKNNRKNSSSLYLNTMIHCFMKFFPSGVVSDSLLRIFSPAALPAFIYSPLRVV